MPQDVAALHAAVQAWAGKQAYVWGVQTRNALVQRFLRNALVQRFLCNALVQRCVMNLSA